MTLMSLSLFGQEELFIKCHDFYNFDIKSHVNLDSNLTINIHDSKYNIVYSLDHQSLNYYNIMLNEVDFFKINLPFSRFNGEENYIGNPNLPFISFSLQIPKEISNDTIYPTNISCTFEEFSVKKQYYPYQDVLGDYEAQFIYNEDYYLLHHNLNDYIYVSAPFKAGNTTGINVKISPIQYDPLSGIVRIIKSISFDIPLNGYRLSDIFAYEFLDAEGVIDVKFLKENTQIPLDSNYLGKILIIISDENYRNDLYDYINHKRSKGYNTERVSINDIKKIMESQNLTAEILRNYLYNKYHNTNIHNRPKFLLLIGNYEDIPYSLSNGTNNDASGNFYSDIYYGCLNSLQTRQESDLYPEMFVGRWPISSINQLKIAINKTITFENSINEFPELYNIMLLSGIENDADSINIIEEKKHLAISYINNILNQKFLYQNISTYDGRNYINKTNSIKNILKQNMNSDLWMFIYYGHGSNSSLGNPISLKGTELSKFYYSTIPPIALSFACLTNRIDSYWSDSLCYGKNWLLNNSLSGGVLHYGATGMCYTNLSEQLLKYVAGLLNANVKKSIAMPLQIGAAKFYANSKNDQTRDQAEKHCIYGDPSLLIFGDSNTIIAPQNSKQAISEITTIFNIELINKYFEDNSDYYVYDVNGKLLYRDHINHTTIDKINLLPSGVYFISIRNKNYINTHKIVINH